MKLGITLKEAQSIAEFNKDYKIKDELSSITHAIRLSSNKGETKVILYSISDQVKEILTEEGFKVEVQDKYRIKISW